jgi:hypothetical protein
VLPCPKCHTLQPASHINTGTLLACPGCGELIRTDVFNAFARKEEGKGETAAGNDPVAGRSVCFYHAGKGAAFACDACGRLLCDLCRVELNGRNLCLPCLQAGRDQRKIGTLQNQRLLNDGMALQLAFWPALMVFPTLLTAPVAIFFAIRHWKTPAGPLPRPIVKSLLALLLAAGQLTGWAVFFINRFG